MPLSCPGRHTREQLIELAQQADAGFDRRVLADLSAMLQRYLEAAFRRLWRRLGSHLHDEEALREVARWKAR